MSIDTLRLSIPVGTVPLDKFEFARVQENKLKGTYQEAHWTTGKDSKGKSDPRIPRITYYPPGSSVNDMGEVSPGLMSVETSLPKIVHGENYSLINQDDMNKGMMYLQSWISDYFGIQLHDWKSWKVSRLDGVYSWQVGENMTHYLQAFQSRPVHKYTRSNYVSDTNQTQGFSWITKSRRVNAYDKGLESGKAEAMGLLRLEVQNLNSKSVNRLCKRMHCERTAGELVTEKAGREEVAHWLIQIGMGEEIKAKGDLYQALVSQFGAKGAAPRWFFIQGYKQFGASLRFLPGYSERTYKRHLSEANKNGWLLESEKNLPGLSCPDPEP